MAAAWPPVMAALAASTLLLRAAASTPSSSAATLTSDEVRVPAMLRAMCRCVTCASSCASTEAIWSRVLVMAIRPRCTPTYPPGSAKAFTLRSLIRKASKGKARSVSASISPRSRAAATRGAHSV